MEEYDEEYIPQYDETPQEFTSEGKKIIAAITVENQVYYMDESKNIFEKVGKVYLEITNQKVIEKVRQMLMTPTEDMYLDY